MKVEAILGFARRAGRLAVGTRAALRSAERKDAQALLIARDASERLRRNAGRVASMRAIPLFEWGTKDSLGTALGRTEVGIVAVCDEHLAQSLVKALTAPDDEKGLR